MRLFTDSFYYHCSLHQSGKELPYLLMLHGFMGSSEVFSHLLDDLKQFCNPITIDLAGHGKTSSPADPSFYTADRQAAQLCSVISRLKFDNLYLYGYSMGGRLAFQLVSNHTNLFSGAVIESAHCGIESDTERSSRFQLDEKRAEEIEKDFDGFVRKWNQMPLFQHTPTELKSVYEDIMMHQTAETIAASLHGFGAGSMPNVCSKIKNMSIPLTLIAGEHDQKYMNLMNRMNDKFASSELHIIKNAGHRVHTDQPGELICKLKRAVTKK